MSEIIQILKISTFLMKNFTDFKMRKSFDPKTVKFGVWGLKISFGQFGPKRLKKSKVLNPSFIFYN